MPVQSQPDPTKFDTGSDKRFVDDYARESISESHVHRFHAIRKTILRVLGGNRTHAALDVADIGCGAGTQCRIWAAAGDRVFGLDVNEALVRLGSARAAEAGLNITFKVGSATSIPWPAASVDVCIAPELLEHVADWESCLREFDRILRPGGVLYLTTTNKLCPKQQEFDLPLYSWYPGFMKRRYERLAVTTRPELASYATYPAVNWFSFYSLRRYLEPLGYQCLDRFDTMDVGNNPLKRRVLSVIRNVPGARFIAHVLTPSTRVVALKSRIR